MLIREGDPVRLGPDVRGRVYALVDGRWTLLDKAVDLPEGWYLVPPSFAEKEK